MNKLLLIGSSCCLLAGCYMDPDVSNPYAAAGATPVSASVMEGNTNPPTENIYLMSYDKDTVGADQFPQHRAATGSKVVIFDPKIPAWAAYDGEGNRVKTGRASGGKSYCPDVGRPCRTVTGTFKVYSKGGPECISHKFPLNTNGGAPTPYCMHFHKGYAMHGSYDVPNQNASHGCVRVLPSAARWLNQDFVNIGTTLIVKPYYGA